jgi:hypothetical protein
MCCITFLACICQRVGLGCSLHGMCPGTPYCPCVLNHTVLPVLQLLEGAQLAADLVTSYEQSLEGQQPGGADDFAGEHQRRCFERSAAGRELLSRREGWLGSQLLASLLLLSLIGKGGAGLPCFAREHGV